MEARVIPLTPEEATSLLVYGQGGRLPKYGVGKGIILLHPDTRMLHPDTRILITSRVAPPYNSQERFFVHEDPQNCNTLWNNIMIFAAFGLMLTSVVFLPESTLSFFR